VEGRGILTYPRQVVSFQSNAEGQIVALNVKVGDVIQSGDVIARINQPQIKQRLEQEYVKLKELESRTATLGSIRTRKTDLEQKAIEQKHEALKERIVSTRKQASIQKRLVATLQERYKNFQQLRKKNVISDTNLLDTRTAAIEAEGTYQSIVNEIADFRAQLKELDIELARIDQQQEETRSDETLQLQETRDTIARLEADLRNKGELVSEHGGRILELTGAIGQFITAGQRLGTIETEDATGKLMAVSYFRVSDGKRIKSGVGMRITPGTVQRERYGSMLGAATTVSRFAVTTDAIANVVGNAEVAREFTKDGSKIEVVAQLEFDSSTTSGFAWTSGQGPDNKVTAGTTIDVRATVEERRPISYVIPILREWSGVQ